MISLPIWALCVGGYILCSISAILGFVTYSIFKTGKDDFYYE